jgi:hypothetical protein
LARPSIDPTHDAPHAIERGTVQRLLEVKRGGLENLGAKLAARGQDHPLRTRLARRYDRGPRRRIRGGPPRDVQNHERGLCRFGTDPHAQGDGP